MDPPEYSERVSRRHGPGPPSRLYSVGATCSPAPGLPALPALWLSHNLPFLSHVFVLCQSGVRGMPQATAPCTWGGNFSVRRTIEPSVSQAGTYARGSLASGWCLLGGRAMTAAAAAAALFAVHSPGLTPFRSHDSTLG